MSLMFFCLSAPLMMSLTMIFMCLLVGWKTFFLFADSWCCLIFLMIFFGGILVLFVYISTLAQNETLIPNSKRFFIFSPLIILMTSFSFIFPNFLYIDSPQSIFIFSSNFFLMSASLISYLLFALVVVSQITYFHFGALRS